MIQAFSTQTHTIEQFLEYVSGLMVSNWYNILQMTMTQVHTEQTLEASGRNWRYGRAKAHEARKT